MSKLSRKTLKKIKNVFRETGSIRGTATKVDVSRNAVRRALRNNSTTQVRKIAPRPSKLDPYKTKIDHLITKKDLSAVRVFDEIVELGYPGSYSTLKSYVRTIRPKRGKGPTTPIDHQPGYEGQMDWSPHRVIIGGQERIVHTGSIVLCFSSWVCMHFYENEKTESVIHLHKKTFHELQSVLETMTYDNMTCMDALMPRWHGCQGAVTTVGRHVGPGEAWMNPEFLIH